MTNPNIRFMANNLASLPSNSFTFSSEAVGFEATNALNSFRSSTWKTTGHFEITSSNNLLYINDGSNKTATVTTGDYTTPTALATAIATALNAISSLWTCTYDIIGGSYTFTIAHTGSVTLRLSVTTNAIWDTIGYVTGTDRVGTSFPADQQRNHTNEFLQFDFGWITPITFVALISDVATSFPLSFNATVTLQGNNVADFTSPAFSKTLTVTDAGIYEFNINDPEVSHRFWRLNIIDKFNSVLGPFLEFGNIYMGDFQTLELRNISAGFDDTLVDPSIRSESEGGVLFFDKRTKFTRLSSIPLQFLEDADKQIIKDVFRTVGITEPFYVSLDPELLINNDITEFTKFVLFDSEPTFNSQGACYFSTILNFKEVV